MGNYIPTSEDIYLEVNGTKLAVVESYRAAAVRESRHVEAFGESEPVATIAGRTRYNIELSRVYATGQMSDGVDFYGLSDFNLVIVKPDCRVVYSGCQWASLNETGELGDTVLEKAVIAAAGRMVIR